MKDKALPEGWNKINITKVFTQISTTGKNIATKDCLSVGKYPVIDQGAEYISGYFNDETKVIPVENKVIVFGDHTRNFKLIDFDFIVGADGVKIFQPAKDIDPDFFYYQCLSLNLPNKGYHRHFRYLKECDFIYPSFSQQQKLAKKFTALLSQVAEIKQRLEKIPVLLKTYRQSVLARAVNGELSAKWREENGVSLESWVYEKAQHICDKVQSGSTPKGNPFEQNGTIPFLKVYNIVNQELNFDYKPQFVTKEQHSQRSITLPNDVLMNIVGPPLGKVAIVTNQYSEWNINQAITLFRCNPRNLHYKFFYFVLREGRFIREIEHDLKGIVGQINISLSQCRDMIVPVPTLEEQIHITQAVEKHLNFANQLEAQVNAALERVNLMTQAILAKGFRGELL
ncbi:restriction endonuclease subunit S [Glaesserella parasuis]|nr:restriction endonuclease subunit S [Glaesserella parasuis]MDP0369002.1 restriction endonuclease subunit S [Glaesserella parasuis]